MNQLNISQKIADFLCESKQCHDKKDKVFTFAIDKLTNSFVEEYDSDGRLAKIYFLNVSNEFDGVYRQKVYCNKKLILFILMTYQNGVLCGKYEIKKYIDDSIVYDEKMYYARGKLEGFNEIKEIINDTILCKFYFYSNGLKNGPFREVIGDCVVEGNYKNGVIDGQNNV